MANGKITKFQKIFSDVPNFNFANYCAKFANPKLCAKFGLATAGKRETSCYVVLFKLQGIQLSYLKSLNTQPL